LVSAIGCPQLASYAAALAHEQAHAREDWTHETCIISIRIASAIASAMASTTVSQDVTTNTNWVVAGSPYILTQNIRVTGALNPTLTVAAGVEVRSCRIRSSSSSGDSWS
jgi:hypothetical protein